MAKNKYNDLVEEMAMGSQDEGFDLMQKRQAQMQREQQMLQAQARPDQSNLTKTGELTAAGGAAALNPYVAGAGLVLQGAGMVDDAKRKNEQAKIDAYNNKIMAQRSAIRNMFG